MTFAAVGVYVDGDRFRIRVKLKPGTPWQDWAECRPCRRSEALEALTSLGLAPARAHQMIEFAIARGASASHLRASMTPGPATSKARPGGCPSCEAPALVTAPNETGFVCLACGYAGD